MPKAYWIAHVDITDPERYQDYVSTASPAFAEYGAKFLARGGPMLALEGQSRTRNVVIEFASLADAQACYESPAYREARAIRGEVSTADIVIVEGVES
ncbi:MULTISPECIES: DUF1330 domain-containing protein [unclassified Aureimonas]|uniref:DUF1330 domain-containing protein n=1 Tax=unclassified Aureimonas TaxID=2615206 RepID=UPI000700F93F|nr:MULTISPECIES: DUF1330 domain-containing protein [unclassified Aureimonas]KQT64404.1 hypothetical protein ASG62_05405 [Aureimonas sp. Leaf427]KQT81594.1 hypothetical protein ASG54_02685 [Aureimonas sp. Leaf460]